eukprot:1111682-Ditylum_brightwellii.AAC.1
MFDHGCGVCLGQLASCYVEIQSISSERHQPIRQMVSELMHLRGRAMIPPIRMVQAEISGGVSPKEWGLFWRLEQRWLVMADA